MTTNENRRQGRHSLHGGEHQSKYISAKTIGLRLTQCNLALAARSVLKRLIVRIAMRGILSPQMATRLLTRLGLVSA
jgi:hypothetical protein